jgi:hypothetical protein
VERGIGKALNQRFANYTQHLGPIWGRFQDCFQKPPTGGRGIRKALNQRFANYMQHLGPIRGRFRNCFQKFPPGEKVSGTPESTI